MMLQTAIIMIKNFPNHPRHGAHAGKANAHFLNARPRHHRQGDQSRKRFAPTIFLPDDDGPAPVILQPLGYSSVMQ